MKIKQIFEPTTLYEATPEDKVEAIYRWLGSHNTFVPEKDEDLIDGAKESYKIDPKTLKITSSGVTDIHWHAVEETAFPYKVEGEFGDFFINRANVRNLTNASSAQNVELVDCPHLENLVGLPEYSQHPIAITIKDCPKFTSLKGIFDKMEQIELRGVPMFNDLSSLPKQLTHTFAFGATGLTSLKDIHKHLKKCKYIQVQTGSESITSNILGLLKIEGLQKIDFLTTVKLDHPFYRAMRIVDNHLRNNKNVPECQQELIEEGLQEYAKL